MQKKGVITIYTSLVLTLLMSFFLGIIENARTNAMKIKAECTADLAFESALAQYHRDLLNRYGLFFIDTSYGRENAGPANVSAQIERFARMNLDPMYEKSETITYQIVNNYLQTDLYGLSTNRVELTEGNFAADKNCLVFRHQVMDYMENRYGITFLKELSSNVMGLFEMYESAGVVEDEDKVEREIDQLREAYKDGIEDFSVYGFTNPLTELTDSSPSFLLNYALGNKSSSVSTKQEDLNLYISHRTPLFQGNGEVEDIGFLEGVEEAVLLGEYILEKSGCYLAPSDSNGLNYGAEYVIAGKESDRENLKSVIRRIFVTREIINLAHIWSDPTKVEFIKALSEIPYIGPFLMAVVPLVWTHLESKEDVKRLLNGEEIAFIKSHDTWVTGFLGYPGGKGGGGFSYQDYMRCLMMIEFGGNEKKALRMMDLIEMDLQKMTGNSHFRMDYCMDSMVGTVYFESSFGYHYEITKKRHYHTGASGVG